MRRLRRVGCLAAALVALGACQGERGALDDVTAAFSPVFSDGRWTAQVPGATLHWWAEADVLACLALG